ncbi:hypothetical protein DH2020_008203 [Rehmannia glutinosa]|uniref:Kinesin-like protein n=1 Tax=Rehmannia glutinosa TaxID=99300 RepID=A0ABR0U0R4_REHGL
MEANSSGEDCCVKVAVHIRPLIGDERLQGCKDCVSIVPGKPQCSHDLNLGDFAAIKSWESSQFYARSYGQVCAMIMWEKEPGCICANRHPFVTFDHVYGSTGSPSIEMYDECVSPLVDGLFQGYNATVLAYGQIHKEEVRDLLDLDSASKQELANGHAGKVTSPGKPPIQIRETSNGVITLAGSTECSVKTLKEMADCLEQGSLSRATGSTNMNNQSRLHPGVSGDGNLNDCMTEDYLSAKLHLVDLAGSERAKRTGSDGLRFKEGVHINKGLLALGNVISALGDEKKRKEGVHVPYRDSKLTRLLQDSLGGNSRTVMIACVSPADINAEETLNTLKYANRVINRDPISNEMLKMRQQLEYLQAELCARGGGVSFDEIQVCESGVIKSEGLKRGLQSMESSDYQMSEGSVISDSGDIDEDTAKELEHTYWQNSMDKELNELNRQLQQKECERDRLLAEVENLSANSDGQAQKLQDMHAHKLKVLEAQIQDLKKKQENQVQLLKQKQKSDEAARKLQEEIQFIKAQKVQLHQKIKQEAEQFRQWKASREKELLQIPIFSFNFSERWIIVHAEYDKSNSTGLAIGLRLCSPEKTEEAAMATKRLKELLEARKSSPRENSGNSNGNGVNGQSNEKSLQRWLDHELEVMVNVHEVRYEYERQSQVRAALAEELAVLRQVDEFAAKGVSPLEGKMVASSMSPSARMSRIASLESMLSISSNSLVAMASQLSEAEERERSVSSRGRWNQLRSMGMPKPAPVRIVGKKLEIKEMKEQMKELVGLLRQSELRRKEIEKELKHRDQAASTALATPPSV